MFYDIQNIDAQEKYKNMLSILGALSGLFSESEKPMLYYRAHENCFCKFFNADNLGRHDCSADAKKNSLGIGLKTWVGSNGQKVAEFGKLRGELEGLSNKDLIFKVSEFRNERLKTTKNIYGINKLIYHTVVRDVGKMIIMECPLDFIDIENIIELTDRNGANTLYFTDNKHIYFFNKAKTTLYMVFDDLIKLDEVSVSIASDPFELLEEFKALTISENKKEENRMLCLKLYSESKKNGCFVPEKSGLNQWNAGGRKRNFNEVYIPFPAKDRKRVENIDFFPSRDQDFDLILPDGKIVKAKVCQDDGKAIMSNPNKDLGEWLLRDVLELEYGKIINYSMLQKKGFDAVLFEKIDDYKYKINFTDSSIYNEMYL